MNTVNVRNIEIGSGIPKICVPIVGENKEEILEEAENIRKLPIDVAEWRVDWFKDAFIFENVEEVLKELRKILGDIPLLLTFRTAGEGGEKEIENEAYAAFNIRAAKTGYIDLLDVEAFRGDELVKSIIDEAHAAGVKVIASNHDFNKTPDKDEIVRRLQKMQELGGDIPKIAVMPGSKKDVLTLLAATQEMKEKFADRPIITMSMAKDGVISRLCGEVFGSALTFGAAKKASAPGQMNVEDLKSIMTMLHNAM